MNKRRLKKISNQIKQIVSDLIMQEKIKDYRVDTLVSITDVETTDDLRYCYIYVSHLEDDMEKAAETLAGLKSAKGFVRREIGKVVSLQYTPEPVFRLDNSIKKGMKIEEILQGLKNEKEDN